MSPLVSYVTTYAKNILRDTDAHALYMEVNAVEKYD